MFCRACPFPSISPPNIEFLFIYLFTITSILGERSSQRFESLPAPFIIIISAAVRSTSQITSIVSYTELFFPFYPSAISLFGCNKTAPVAAEPLLISSMSPTRPHQQTGEQPGASQGSLPGEVGI